MSWSLTSSSQKRLSRLIREDCETAAVTGAHVAGRLAEHGLGERYGRPQFTTTRDRREIGRVATRAADAGLTSRMG